MSDSSASSGRVALNMFVLLLIYWAGLFALVLLISLREEQSEMDNLLDWTRNFLVWVSEWPIPFDVWREQFLEWCNSLPSSVNIVGYDISAWDWWHVIFVWALAGLIVWITLIFLFGLILFGIGFIDGIRGTKRNVEVKTVRTVAVENSGDAEQPGTVVATGPGTATLSAAPTNQFDVELLLARVRSSMLMILFLLFIIWVGMAFFFPKAYTLWKYPSSRDDIGPNWWGGIKDGFAVLWRFFILGVVPALIAQKLSRNFTSDRSINFKMFLFWFLVFHVLVFAAFNWEEIMRLIGFAE